MIAGFMHTKRTSSSGFTLFELIVAIGIIVLMFGLALAGFNRFNKRERLRQSGLTLKSNLRFAQTKALSAEKPTSGCTTFLGMQISFTSDTYTIRHLCTEGVVGSGTQVTLPPGITFSPTPSTFTFLTLSKNISIASGQNLVLESGTDSYQLSISGGGEISNQ